MQKNYNSADIYHTRGLLSCAKDRMREKTREQTTENKTNRKWNFKKKQLPFNLLKQYFASFITKLLKYKICSNSAASDSIFLPFLYSASINTHSLKMITFFPNFRLLKSDWLIFIFAHSVLRVWGIPPSYTFHQQKIHLSITNDKVIWHLFHSDDRQKVGLTHLAPSLIMFKFEMKNVNN